MFITLCFKHPRYYVHIGIGINAKLVSSGIGFVILINGLMKPNYLFKNNKFDFDELYFGLDKPNFPARRF